MTTKTVYLFDPVTGLFTVTYEAHESPEEPGKFNAPDHSTPHPVPVLAANEAAVFDVAADAWTVVPDFRGQTFFDQVTGAEVVIKEHGAVPANLGPTLPLSIQLERAKTAKTAVINTDCATAIVSGFESAALGAVHHYTATLEDQANLSDLIQIGIDDEFTCTDKLKVKESRPHTIAQLKQVQVDGAAHKKTLLARARLLKNQLASIQPSPDALAAVEAIKF